MDDANREALQERLKTFDRAGDPFCDQLSVLEEAARPYRIALAAIADAREAMLEALGVQIAGTCEHCKKLLFAGELGSTPYRDENFIYCEACSPTWEDLVDSLPDAAADDDEDQAVLREVLIQRQRDGTLREKAGVEPLEPDMQVF